MKNIFRLLFFWGLGLPMLFSQPTLSADATMDLTRRSMVKIGRFTNYVETIGAAKYSRRTRLKGIELGTKLFSKEAKIEEQNKNSTYKKKWKPNEYLNNLLVRGESTPRIISFEVIDDLLPSELQPVTNEDGSISYTGKIRVNQYYCKLKQGTYLKEPTSAYPDINCSYKDNTIKEIGIEIKLVESVKGKLWVTLISYIKVERVY